MPVERLKNSDPNSKFKQGRFIPRYPEKYLGDVSNIIFRSSWELRTFEMLDGNPNIIHWVSEEIKIPYIVPDSSSSTGYKQRTYFPDLYVEYYDRSNTLIKELIEIKPEKQTKPSKSKKSHVKLLENQVFIINKLKWNAAQVWCDKRGIKFSIMTEKSIFR